MIVFHAPETEGFGGYFWSILNSNFSAALFGALFGALSAHYIAQRSEMRKSLAEGIAGCSSALAFANNVASYYIGLKRQHTMEIVRLYREAFQGYAVNLLIPENVRPVFHLRTDFRTLPVQNIGLEHLREVIVDKLPGAASIIYVTGTLQSVTDAFVTTARQREEMFPYLRSLPPVLRADTYFGLRISEDMVDERFSDIMTAISLYVDDGIYFSLLTMHLLSQHGEKLREQYGRKAPELAKVTRTPLEDDVLPDVNNYRDWENAYRSPPVSKPTGWKKWYVYLAKQPWGISLFTRIADKCKK